MSSTLKIRPLDKGGKTLSFELKQAVRKRYGGSIDRIIDESDISYFKGLYDSGIEDAKIVIEYLEKYEECELEEQY